MGNSPAIHEAGQEFHKYRLREPLSDSFLGTRYRAVSSSESSARAASNAFGSDITGLRSTAFALRLLRAPAAGLIERVAQAAKAVRFLDHTHILAPIQLIRSQTRLGVITQDVDGCTLSDLMGHASLRGEALPQAVALRIALDVLEGVITLHACEANAKRTTFACGGLTPDSVHIGKDGRARLIDPGVAGAAASLPFWGHDPVALAYTAPEQSGAEPAFNPSSDVFSIGVMLWEMLAGRTLFGGATAAETLEHLHKSIIPRVQRYQFVRGEPIAASVAQIVAHALQRDPELRYKTATELAKLLVDADDVATHAEVAEHCHRLAANSAGVFDGAVRVRQVMSAAEFELPTNGLPRASQPSLPTPPPSIESLRPERATTAELPVDAFEPATAKIDAPLVGTLFARAPERPEPILAESRAEPHRPITAFPISDLVRTSPAVRQVWAPLAAAAAIVLGIGYLAIQQLSSRTFSPPRAAVAQPPIAASLPEPAPALEPVQPAIAVASPVEPMPPAFGGPVPQPIITIENTAAGAPVAPMPESLESKNAAAHKEANANKKSDPSRRRSKSAAAAEDKPPEPQAGAVDVPHGPFIPDDL
jgi:eukaryotic-like serine/threonine-protein kinase